MSPLTGRTSRSISVGRLIALLTFMAFCLGCSSPNDTASKKDGGTSRAAKPAPIRVLVVDDEPLAETIERQWNAASEAEIQVKHVSALDVASLKSETTLADVVIYPSPWLGDFVERNMLIPVSSRVLDDAQYDRSDIMLLDQTAAVSWGEKTYAFSFGIPQLVLMYRKDILDRLDLAAPATWTEYQQVIDQVAKEMDAGGLRAAVEPLAPGWAAQMLLARAAPYARQRSRYWTLFDYATMEPMIKSPPFQRALAELVAAARKGKIDVSDMTASKAREALATGRAVMAITWPTRVDASAVESDVEIGFAPLPGSRSIYNLSSATWETLGGNRVARVPLFGYDGRLGSVLTSSANPRDAFNFLAWLTGSKRSASICAKSSHTAPFRFSHKSAAGAWVPDSRFAASAEAYFSAVSSMKRETLMLSVPRIPGREEYLAALDQAVADGLSGKDTTAALETAANRWREITERLGVEEQRAVYKRSLGLEP